MKNIGTVELESNRLLFRKASISDSNAMFNNWANDKEVTKYLRWDAYEKEEDTIKFLNYLDIKRWKSSLPEFYEKYYGKEARTIIEKLEYYEHDYFKARKSISINQIAGEFAVLLDAVYEKGFIERKKQLVRILKNDELILPMWY